MDSYLLAWVCSVYWYRHNCIHFLSQAVEVTIVALTHEWSGGLEANRLFRNLDLTIALRDAKTSAFAGFIGPVQ